MTIFNLSGETNERDRLLSLLMEWTTEPKLVSAMVQRQRADFPGLAMLAAMVQATRDGGSETSDGVQAQPMTERQMAASVLAFLMDPEVKRAIAAYVATAHAVETQGHETKQGAALRDLEDLRRHLKTTHKLGGRDIPRLIGGDPVAAALSAEAAEYERSLTNPAMAWAAGEPKPEWVVDWEQDDGVDPDMLAQGLRELPESLRDLAKRFPPFCLVRATQEIVCPKPGLVAIVRDYMVEQDVPVLQVSAYVDGSRVGCKPEWLEPVAYRGGSTPEIVAGVLG